MIYVILDNLSAHKAKKIQAWCAKHNVELCFTPTYSSWANPIECHFGPLREFVLNNSDHLNHTVLTRRIHSYLRWRNANARDPEVLRPPAQTPRRDPRRDTAPLGSSRAPSRLTVARTEHLSRTSVLHRARIPPEDGAPPLIALRCRHPSLPGPRNKRSRAACKIAQRANVAGQGTSEWRSLTFVAASSAGSGRGGGRSAGGTSAPWRRHVERSGRDQCCGANGPPR